MNPVQLAGRRDGQGDLGGHGGEQRAVFVYQSTSYRYWERELGRDDFVPGQFGENFTVDGLEDDEVCIGDRYRIGTAVFEVSQPRVTCYRVGIRMDDARIPALLVSHKRPGFYLRVVTEGEVQAGDEIFRVAEGAERMTVAEIDGLLYLPGHPREGIERALRIPALSPGWQSSFRALVEEEGNGNAGLGATSPPPAWLGFRPHIVSGLERESDSIVSIKLVDPDGTAVPRSPPRAVSDAPPSDRPGQVIPPPQLFAVGAARCGLLPHQRQARAEWGGERLSAHAAARSATNSRSQLPAAPSPSTRPTRLSS